MVSVAAKIGMATMLSTMALGGELGRLLNNKQEKEVDVHALADQVALNILQTQGLKEENEA